MNQQEHDFWAEVARLLPPVKEIQIEYRLHYDVDGNITMCSMTDHPESERYIVVDEGTYCAYYDYRIVKGKPVLIIHDVGYRRRLVPAENGFCVVKNHAGLLLEPGETFDNVEYYERNN
jgi:hypothetical protein